MNTLSADFQFNIGDLVVLKSSLALSGPKSAPVLSVVERYVNQCHGGIQSFLLVRPLGRPDHPFSGGQDSSFGGPKLNGWLQVCDCECVAAPPESLYQEKAEKKADESGGDD